MYRLCADCEASRLELRDREGTHWIFGQPLIVFFYRLRVTSVYAALAPRYCLPSASLRCVYIALRRLCASPFVDLCLHKHYGF